MLRHNTKRSSAAPAVFQHKQSGRDIKNARKLILTEEEGESMKEREQER